MHPDRKEAPTMKPTLIRRAIEDLPGRMSRFFGETYGMAAFDEAWDEFMLWELEIEVADTPLIPLFVPWMYHSWQPDAAGDTCVVDASLHGRPPTTVFLERQVELDPLARRYLEACLDAPFSFDEVVRCDRGQGFRARDLITGEEREVQERSASKAFEVGDVFFGQLVPIDGIVLLEACSPYVHSPIDKIPIVELRREIMDSVGDGETALDALGDWDLDIRETYLGLIEPFLKPPPPMHRSPDSDGLAWTH
jgi:hypothetical protein